MRPERETETEREREKERERGTLCDLGQVKEQQRHILKATEFSVIYSQT